MSESNVYVNMYFDDKADQDSFYHQLLENKEKGIEDEFHNYLEADASIGTLINLSFFGGNIILQEITKVLKKAKANGMLVTLSHDTGDQSRFGYLDNKKVKYEKAERWMAEQNDAIRFQLAFYKRDKKTIEAMLVDGFDLNLLPFADEILWNCDFQREGPLILLLIKHGANIIDEHGSVGGSLLIDAITLAKTDVFEALLDAGADPLYINEINGYNLMHFAVGGYYGTRARKICKRLIELGVDVNHKSNSGITPLMLLPYDIKENPLATLKLLEKASADLHCETKDKGNLLWLAHNQHISRSGWMPLPESLISAKESIVGYLLKKGIEPKLPLTVLNGEEAYADHVIENGVIKEINYSEYPLWFKRDLHLAIESNDLETVKKEVKEGTVYFNYADTIEALASSENTEIVRYVFSLGLNLQEAASHIDIYEKINAVSTYRSEKENQEGLDKLKLFLDNGLRLIDPDREPRLFAHNAIIFNTPSNITRRTDSPDDEKNHPILLEFTKIVIDEMLKARLDINIPDSDSFTMLMHAAKKSQVDIVKHLLNKGALCSVTTDDDETALDIALREGRRLTRHHKEDTHLKACYSGVISLLGGDPGALTTE